MTKKAKKVKCEPCEGTGQCRRYGYCFKCGKCAGTGKYDPKQSQDPIDQILRNLKSKK